MTVRDDARLRRGHNDQSCRGHQCRETMLTGESRFHISTPPRGFEPGSLVAILEIPTRIRYARSVATLQHEGTRYKLYKKEKGKLKQCKKTYYSKDRCTFYSQIIFA